VAQSASQAKTQLLSRVSHELRTPLNAVIGFSHLLMLDPDRLDTASRRQVQHISDAGQHLLALVDEVLQINQTEAGLLALDLQPVWLAAVARQVLALAQPLALPMALTLELVDGGGGDPLDGPQALADPRRVREVLTNLVSNAIKYNRPDGQVRLTLGNDAQWAWIEIHDTGIGMSLAQQAHLFEPFNRLGAEQLKISGNGLGLSIARTLVHAMGGEMRVYSTPGEGSGFRVILPRWAAPLAANPDIGC
jgi:signal transduction histidine kinase